MSGLLYGIGAFAVVAGAVLVGFGVPINEFSFGNTLILAGMTCVVGGLIVVGLGVVVSQLQRLTDALAMRAPMRADRPAEMFEPTAQSRPASPQIPIPPKPKTVAVPREPASPDLSNGSWAPTETPAEQAPAAAYAPTLRNPYEPPAAIEDEVSISPQHPIPAPAPAAAAPELEKERLEPHAVYFDAMWPAETKPAKSPADSGAKPYAPSSTEGHESGRSVAILKSGVVDGMGYTLYVDGSIEAELPQGTLRFASIKELRSHLENNA
jgi:hypothetical protein